MRRVVLLVGLEAWVGPEEAEDLIVDHADVRLEVLLRETNFDETLLFHEHVVGTVVNDALAEDRCREVLRWSLEAWV